MRWLSYRWRLCFRSLWNFRTPSLCIMRVYANEREDRAQEAKVFVHKFIRFPGKWVTGIVLSLSFLIAVYVE
jgi:hypothetical protein